MPSGPFEYSKMKSFTFFILLVIALFSFETYAANTAVWTMVDCNAGGSTQDCHLLREGGVTAIVDTGTEEATEKYFIPYLKRNNILKVEHFIVSHPHDNHVGGLLNIMRSGIVVKNIYFSMPVEGHFDFAYDPPEFRRMLLDASKLGAKIHSVRKGDVIRLGDSIINILEAPKTRQNEINDYSIIMRWQAGGYTTLFTGDLSEQLGARLAGDPIFSADFYKAPHHGVTPIAPVVFSDTVSPILTMIPGPLNLWRHPRSNEFKTWTEAKSRESNMITCTNGLNGHVSIVLSNTFYEINPEREANGCNRQKNYILGRDVPRVRVNSHNLSALLSYLLGV